ncbi:unnamed protein product, partial [marine sediment metagenome]
FIEGSVLDEEVLKRAFSTKLDFVFHFAAHFANQNSVDNPEIDLEVNGLGTLKVLQYTHLVNVKRLVYSSSGCGVYGLDSKMPFEEHDISISLHTGDEDILAFILAYILSHVTPFCSRFYVLGFFK